MSDFDFFGAPPPFNLKGTPGGGVPPKNSESIGGNIDRVVDPPKIPKEPRKKVQKAKFHIEMPTDEEIRQEGIVRIHEGDEIGVSPKDWRPSWNPRKCSPYRRSLADNAKTVQAINAAVQTDLPAVTVHDREPGQDRRLNWDVVEADLVEFLSAGGTVSTFCRTAHISRRAVELRCDANPDFKAKVQRARELGTDALAAEALEIASTPKIVEETIEVYDKNDNLVSRSIRRGDNVHARKLAFNARMMLLEKWAPEKYGPKPLSEATGGMADKLRKARDRIRAANREAMKRRGKDLRKALEQSKA